MYHETTDATDFAVWGVDYLAYGNCYNEGIPALDRYTAMSKALQATGRSIYYSVRNWGNEQIWEWGWKVADTWRTTKPIERTNDDSVATNQWQALKGNFLQNQFHAIQAGPYRGWNDPDKLLIGLGLLTPTEEKTQFALWSFARAPLFFAADLTQLADSSLDTLINKGLIGINQDYFGQQAKCAVNCDFVAPASGQNYQVYTTPVLQDDGIYTGMLIVNWEDTASVDVNVDLVDLGLATSGLDECISIELWSGDQSVTKGSAQAFKDIPPHGNIVRKL